MNEIESIDRQISGIPPIRPKGLLWIVKSWGKKGKVIGVYKTEEEAQTAVGSMLSTIQGWKGKQLLADYDIAAWDRPPQRISISPETDTPEDAEIRALVKKRHAEKLNRILTRNAEEALKNCGIESIDRILTKPRKKKVERKR